MKKLLSTFISGVMAVSSVSVLAGSAKEPDNSLWNKFLKYDLCITDYSSLSAEDKALCHFIFDTEQSSDQLIYCARARKELAHDQYIGNRLTLDELEGAYGIFDRYNQPTYCWQNYIHCVPDIVYMDNILSDDQAVMEYWLDDTGETYVKYVEKYNADDEKSFEVYDRKDGLIQTIKATEWETDAKDFRDSDEDMQLNGFVEKNGGWYMLLPDGTASFECSELSFGKNADGDVSDTFVIESEVNGCPVTAIENGAFSGTSYTEIILPDTIEYIDSLAFFPCQYLEKVNFPKGLKYIGRLAFGRCNSLTEITIDCPDLVLSTQAFYGCTGLTDAQIMAKEIGDFAFAGCENLSQFTIGEGTARIGYTAFGDDNGLAEIKIPESVSIIEQGAFRGISTTVTISPATEIIGAYPNKVPAETLSIGPIPPRHPLTDEPICAFSSDCVIRGYRGTEADRYAQEWGLAFDEIGTDAGDVNIDSKVNMSDAVSLQRYLLGRYVPTGAYYGDMTGDGNVNVYDMIALKDEIVK